MKSLVCSVAFVAFLLCTEVQCEEEKEENAKKSGYHVDEKKDADFEPDKRMSTRFRNPFSKARPGKRFGRSFGRMMNSKVVHSSNMGEKRDDGTFPFSNNFLASGKRSEDGMSPNERLRTWMQLRRIGKRPAPNAAWMSKRMSAQDWSAQMNGAGKRNGAASCNLCAFSNKERPQLHNCAIVQAWAHQMNGMGKRGDAPWPWMEKNPMSGWADRGEDKRSKPQRWRPY